MTFGTVQVGRLSLREALTSATDGFATGARTLAITGQEASVSVADVAGMAAVQDDIMGLPGRFLPVTFTDKAGRNAFYRVLDASVELVAWGAEVVTCGWTLSLERVGAVSEVDIESRLSGPLTRTNAHAGTGERWHAPPVGHSSYWAAASSPSVVTRTGADGPVVVYRGVPLATNVRYACTLAGYAGGRARFLDATGRERTGTRFNVAPAGWEINNSLVRVRWDVGGLKVANHDGSTWAERAYAVAVSTTLGVPEQATVLRNDHEALVVRCLWPRSVTGRTTVDLTLRRGARTVELYVRTTPATVISIGLVTPVATSSTAGYLTATANDASGDRYFLGSAGAFTANTVASTISKSSAVAMDAAIGAVINGGSAASGDAATVLFSHYLASPAESVNAIRR